MYEPKDENKPEKEYWSRSGDSKITAQRKYATGAFQRSEDEWRPGGPATPKEPPKEGLEKKVKEEKTGT